MGEALPPSVLSSPSPFSPFSETEKYELLIGLHLKSIISRIANSVTVWTLRPVETRPEGPRLRAESGGGVLGRGSEPRPSATGSGERCKLHQNLDFGVFWDLRNHVRIVS